MSLLKIVVIGTLLVSAVDSRHVCPTWFFWNYSTCECGRGFNNVLECSQATNETKIQHGFCLTYANDTDTEYFGACPYNANDELLKYYVVPSNVSDLNKEMCGPLNRTGLLCSECQPGLGPVVFSYSRECKKCMEQPWGWILFFVRLTVPLTLFCMLVIIFRINLASPCLVMFVLMAQFVTSSHANNPFLKSLLTKSYFSEKIVLDFYGLFSLNFFLYLIPSFCIQEDMSMTTVVVLEYLVALYPIFFTVLVYVCITLHDNGCMVLVICWRPIHKCLVKFRRRWNLKGSVINSFATFILLSYSKICLISIQLTQPVAVWRRTGHVLLRAYFDAKNDLTSSPYVPFTILGAVITCTMVIFPSVLLLLYQNRVFRKFLSMCKIKFQLTHELANITQACFKNGTSPGTRDYRWFAGLYLLMRIFFVISLHHRFNVFLAVRAVVFGAMSLLVAILRPYRIEFYNVIDSVFWLLAAMGVFTYVYFKVYKVMWSSLFDFFGATPFIYLACCAFWKITSVIFKWCRNRIRQQEDTNVLPERLNENTPLLPPA